MISLASRSAFNFSASLASMTVVGITGLIGSFDDFASIRFGLVGLRNLSIVLSGLGVSLNSLVGADFGVKFVTFRWFPVRWFNCSVMLVSVR